MGLLFVLVEQNTRFRVVQAADPLCVWTKGGLRCEAGRELTVMSLIQYLAI